MRYLGGKAKANLGKEIAKQIELNRGGRSEYWEPFLGGCGVFPHVSGFRKYIAGDVHEDLVMMWRALADGWQPPLEVSRVMHAALKHAEPSALRGFVGFGCSYRGDWFCGYAEVDERSGQSYCSESANSVLRAAPSLVRAEIVCRSYLDCGLPSADCVVYCDPPYARTTGYKATDEFNHEVFWEWTTQCANTGAVVLVSEETCPLPNATVVWSKQRRHCVGASVNKPPRTEKLFLVNSIAHTRIA